MTPPRLHVLTSMDGPAALILRRGPSGVVASVGWDRESQALTQGQWLKGRIPELRADLSPDGRHWVYFAGKGGTRWWTAVARAPWLRALAFVPQTHAWGGGGAFDVDGRLWLNGGGWPDGLRDLRPAPGDAFPHSTDGVHMGDLHAVRLERRGWRREGSGYDARLMRDLPGGGWLELRFALGARNRALVSSRYALVDSEGRRSERPDWDWADLWQDRLQFAERGGLHEMVADGTARFLQDLSGLSYEEVRAPYEGSAA